MDSDRAQQVQELERTLWTLVAKLAHRRFGDAIAQASGYDLPPTSWAMLELLSRSGAMRVSEIAAYSSVDISSITPRLKKLEADGFIGRKSDPRDGRVSLISIAPLGTQAVEQIRSVRQTIYAKALANTDLDQLANASMLLRQFADGLEEHI